MAFKSFLLRLRQFKYAISVRLSCHRAERVCPICLETLRSNRVQLSCGHIFHRECLDKWTAVSVSSSTDARCPMCRKVYKTAKNEDIGFDSPRSLGM